MTLRGRVHQWSKAAVNRFIVVRAVFNLVFYVSLFTALALAISFTSTSVSQASSGLSMSFIGGVVVGILITELYDRFVSIGLANYFVYGRYSLIEPKVIREQHIFGT